MKNWPNTKNVIFDCLAFTENTVPDFQDWFKMNIYATLLIKNSWWEIGD